MNRKKIIALEQIIHDDYNNIAGIIVHKGDKIIYENYFNACTATSKIHIASVTKSIISALIGIAIDQGYIKSIE